MARILDERFEAGGLGYDVLSGTEDLGIGSTLTPDANPADAGSPDNWQTECLKADSVGPNFNCFKPHTLNLSGIQYFRDEFVLTAQSLSEGEINYIFRAFTDGGGTTVVQTLVALFGGQLTLRTQVNDDGTLTNIDTNIAINTLYRWECKYDITNNKREIRVNDVVQGSADVDLTLTHPIDIETMNLGAGIGADTGDITIYHDNFAIDDIQWVGAEAMSVTGDLPPLNQISQAVQQIVTY